MKLVATALILTACGIAPTFVQDDGALSEQDFWVVTGLSAGSALNVRKGPSTSSAVTIQISDGTIMRNLGCQGDAQQRWCRVESPDSLAVSGWVSGV